MADDIIIIPRKMRALPDSPCADTKNPKCIPKNLVRKGWSGQFVGTKTYPMLLIEE